VARASEFVYYNKVNFNLGGIMKIAKNKFLKLLKNSEIKLIGKYLLFKVNFIEINRIYFKWNDKIFYLNNSYQIRVKVEEEYCVRILDGISLKGMQPSTKLNADSKRLVKEIWNKMEASDNQIFYEEVDKKGIVLEYKQAKMLKNIRSANNCQYLRMPIFNKDGSQDKVVFLDKHTMEIYWFTEKLISDNKEQSESKIEAVIFPYDYEEKYPYLEYEIERLLYRLKEDNKGIYTTEEKKVFLGMLGVQKKYTYDIDDFTDYDIRNSTFKCFLYDGNRYISYFAEGLIGVSTNGLDWKLLKTSLTENIGDISYNGNIYVGISARRIYVSIDLITWRKVLETEFLLTSICWYHQYFICLGGWSKHTGESSGAIMISEDGIHFKKVLESEWYCRRMLNTAWDGRNYFVGNESGLIMKSTDLVNWEFAEKVITKGNHSFESILDIRVKGNIIIIVGTNSGSTNVSGFTHSYILKSSDGNTFEEVKKISKALVTTIDIVDDMFIASCKKGNIYVSNNGEKWVEQTIDPESNFVKVIKEKETYIAYSDSGDIYTSRDLKTWETYKKSHEFNKNGRYIY